jgi:mRNA interferase HicA
MKRRDLIAHLERHGCRLLREGGRHWIYWNPANQKPSPVPRHAEIADVLVRRICRQLAVSPP